MELQVHAYIVSCTKVGNTWLSIHLGKHTLYLVPDRHIHKSIFYFNIHVHVHLYAGSLLHVRECGHWRSIEMLLWCSSGGSTTLFSVVTSNEQWVWKECEANHTHKHILHVHTHTIHTHTHYTHTTHTHYTHTTHTHTHYTHTLHTHTHTHTHTQGHAVEHMTCNTP